MSKINVTTDHYDTLKDRLTLFFIKDSIHLGIPQYDCIQLADDVMELLFIQKSRLED